MKISIIGAGMVGGALGKSWGSRGHEVTYATRNPSDAKVQKVVSESGPQARAATVADAVSQAEVIVLATNWESTQDAIKSCGDIKDKIILDATNPIGYVGGKMGLTVGFSTSGGEQVAKWAVGARVVKIFNSTGYTNMVSPDYKGQAATMFYCGDDAEAKKVAHSLSSALGFDSVDVGPLSQARLLEPLAMLWITMAFGGQGTQIALKLLKR